jgi:hypothetical protein
MLQLGFFNAIGKPKLLHLINGPNKSTHLKALWLEPQINEKIGANRSLPLLKRFYSYIGNYQKVGVFYRWLFNSTVGYFLLGRSSNCL